MAELSNDSSEFPEFRGTLIADLIGRPMVAVIQANEMMAKEQVKLLMKICFSRVDDTYEPVMITMSIRRGVIEPGESKDSATIRQIVTCFQVPLITLIPINSLAIEHVDIHFSIDVHSQHEVIEERDEVLFGNHSPSRTKPIELAGSIKYQSRGEMEDAMREALQDESWSADLSINMFAGSLPLPLGVSTILQAYSQSIYPSDASQDQHNDCQR